MAGSREWLEQTMPASFSKARYGVRMPERSGTITIDESLKPIYVVSFEGVPNDAEFEAYLKRLGAITERPDDKALLFDATRTGNTPPSQRKRMAEWMKQYDALIRERTAGCAFVLPSAIQRGILTAILWLQPMACPHAIVGTREEALAWVRKELARRAGATSKPQRV
jgi:hypothetical protein